MFLFPGRRRIRNCKASDVTGENDGLGPDVLFPGKDGNGGIKDRKRAEMNIRPHHFLCVQNYAGHSYDKNFTEHMDGIVSALLHETDIVIQEGCDDICAACPNNIDGICASAEKVDRMDGEVLEALGFGYGNKKKWNEIRQSAIDRIFTTRLFDKICHVCQWYGICEHITER